jgi:hypothetical protein
MEGSELPGDKLRSKIDNEKKKVASDDKSIVKAVDSKAQKEKSNRHMSLKPKRTPKQSAQPDFLLKRNLKSKLRHNRKH